MPILEAASWSRSGRHWHGISTCAAKSQPISAQGENITIALCAHLAYLVLDDGRDGDDGAENFGVRTCLLW